MLKIDRNKIIVAISGFALAVALGGCATTQENKLEEHPMVEAEETLESPQVETTEETPESPQTETQSEKDNVVESAIEIMLEGAEDLKDLSVDATNSEAFQEELTRALENFKTLSDFVFNGGEINGVTFAELSEEGKAYAKNALTSLDGFLEYLVPNYKEIFSEWLKDTAADGLDALSDLRNKGVELWEDINSRRR